MNKERPILFSAPMVRAILDGRKTQTRRIAPIDRFDLRHHDNDGLITWGVSFSKPMRGGTLSTHSGGRFTEAQARSIIASEWSPYGKTGDRLWVREAFRLVKTTRGGADGDTLSPAQFTDSTTRYEADGAVSYPDAHMRIFGRLRPSIHMTRQTSRIDLEITGVRVERLQDISEADCKAEGAHGGHGSIPGYAYSATPREHYRHIWESINGPDSCSQNPWVWVVEFKRIKPA